jgi:hypothetical protein
MNYLLDIDTLLQVLQEYRIANARLSAPLVLRNSSYRAEVFVQNGRIVSCILRDSSGGVQYQGKEAFQRVQKYGVADWSVMLERPGVQNVAPAQASATAIPSRRVSVIPQQFRLSRLHIQVFALIDGKRNGEQIHQMLSRSVTKQGIEQILRDLQELQLIDFR